MSLPHDSQRSWTPSPKAKLRSAKATASQQSHRFGCISCRYVSLLIFVVTALLLQLFLPYTLMQQESYALFLTTPDYLAETFASPWPLSHLAGNFIVQFFHYPLAGPAIIAFVVTLIFILLGLLLRRSRKAYLAYTVTFLVLLAAGGITLGTHPAVKQLERHSAVEHHAERHDWQRLLQTATPQATRHDRQLLPYALLALAETGQLPGKMFTYPIQSIDDFCPATWTDRSGHTFAAILYECLGLTDETIHQLYQAADALPHGTSFGTLRKLATLYRQHGDILLADKYHDILSCSTLHSHRRHLHSPSDNPAANTPSYPANAPQPRDSVPAVQSNVDNPDATVNPVQDQSQPATSAHNDLLITPDYFYNLTTLAVHRPNVPILQQRFLCALLANRDIARFADLWNSLPHPADAPIPSAYQEALNLATSTLPAAPSGPYASYYFQAQPPR